MYGLIGKMNAIHGNSIARGKPLIASFGEFVHAVPIGGYGL